MKGSKKVYRIIEIVNKFFYNNILKTIIENLHHHVIALGKFRK